MRRRFAIFKDSWLFAYRGIIPQRHLDSMVRQRTPEWWRDAMKTGDSTLVLDVGGAVAGYATLGNSRQRGRYQGEIYELYLDPLYQGLGLGEHLFEGCRHALDMRRLNGLIVWALLDNTAAATSTGAVVGGRWQAPSPASAASAWRRWPSPGADSPRARARAASQSARIAQRTCVWHVQIARPAP